MAVDEVSLDSLSVRTHPHLLSQECPTSRLILLKNLGWYRGDPPGRHFGRQLAEGAARPLDHRPIGLDFTESLKELEEPGNLLLDSRVRIGSCQGH